MNADLDYLYAHHAVGLCPEERCVTAQANLAALVETLRRALEQHQQMDLDYDSGCWCADAERLLQGREASREGRFHGDYPRPVYLEPADYDREDDPPVSPPSETPDGRLRLALAALHPSARYVRVEAIDVEATLRVLDTARADLRGRVASREGSGT
jgi:hypothetical protein